MLAGYGATAGTIIVVAGSVVVDAATGGLNILATPAEVAAGTAIGGLIGYGIGSFIDYFVEPSKTIPEYPIEQLDVGILQGMGAAGSICDPNVLYKPHEKGARKSTKGKHEEGERRRKMRENDKKRNNPRLLILSIWRKHIWTRVILKC